MMDIVFKLEPEIIIGNGTINRAGAICKGTAGQSLGRRALVVSEKALYENRSVERLTAVLADSGVETIVFNDVPAQAMADTAESIAELARGSRCSVIIGFGGPMTQSIARVTAIIASAKLKPSDFLDGEKPESPPVPYIAVPTTVRDPFLFSDSFIVVDSRDRSVKLMPTPAGLCIAAIIDGGLAESPPEKFRASVLFDGFLAAVEAFCSAKAQFISDMFLEKALRFYVKMLDSYAAKQLDGIPEVIAGAGFLMALGAAVSAPGIGTALAYALSGRFPVEKAWCSTALFPPVMERLVAVRPEKMAKLAAIMGETVGGVSTADAAAKAVASIRRRIDALQAPARLKELNLSLDRLVPIAEAARNLAFVAHSPWTVTVEEAYGLLKQAF